ncbi:T9SS type A sorting domain-containing protein [Dyadobacter sp. 3J3]|uniref:T9SS type A sorting domain-containing protein n=1 Tax=Dyadobacter sp. 3J3 TaxID=2606600 RepID=UPI001359A16A|nr:T9SS type A sorting domain-containing protein [Dyadobacter sp. 3J3]
MKIYKKSSTASSRLWVCSLFPLLGLSLFTNAQQASQGNTTVFGGAEITVFGAHNFVTGGGGAQPGIVKTIRTSPFGVLKFGAAATQTAANDANHVDGYVSKIGNSAFTFPTGSGTDLRTLSISAPSTPTAQVTVAWFKGNPGTVSDPSDAETHSVTSLDGPLISVSQAGFWDWIPVTGSFSGLTVTASIPDLTTFATAANLRLAGWDGTQWINLSSAANATGNTEGSTITGTIPATGTISALAIGSITTPLPVTLVSFNAQKSGVGSEAAAALLYWTTSTETNSDHFDIERSENGRNWANIGKVISNGESTKILSYSFKDIQPISGENLYRLRMVDKDGTFAYSRIQSVTFDGTNSDMSVYPNPSVDKLFIRDYSTVKDISVSNLNGISVYKSLSFASGNGFVDLASLSQGIYVVKITRINGTLSTHKIVVRK